MQKLSGRFHLLQDLEEQQDAATIVYTPPVCDQPACDPPIPPLAFCIRPFTREEVQCLTDRDPRMVPQLTAMASSPQRLLQCLSHLPHDTPYYDAMVSLAAAMPELEHDFFPKVWRVYCEVGWGSDDGRDLHYLDRIRGATGAHEMSLTQFLTHVGMWLYSGNATSDDEHLTVDPVNPTKSHLGTQGTTCPWSAGVPEPPVIDSWRRPETAMIIPKRTSGPTRRNRRRRR